MTTAEHSEYHVEYAEWDDFLDWFYDAWEQGQHIAVVAPTGAGKTTLVRGLLDLRKYVLALDEKGGDETLSGSGFERLKSWPGIKAMARKIDANERNSKHSKYIVGPKVQVPEDFARVKDTIAKCLHDAFTMGGWTIYSDEHQLLTDRRMMNLGAEADMHLIAARSKKISFVSSYQSPSWVSKAASRQSSWMAVAYTRDIDVVNVVAEQLGRTKAIVRGWISQLPPYHWLIVGLNPRNVPIIVKPPKG